MKKSPLKKMSPEKARNYRRFLALKPVYLDEHIFCECPGWRGNASCLHRAIEIHHMKGQQGDLMFDERYFMPVCRGCHRHIEDNKKWARSVGAILYK
jgi:hypothetical protein